jgi:hypothetical protein
MKRFFIFSFAIVLLLPSCREIFGKKIKGNGNITRQSRSISGFSGVSVSGNIDIYLNSDSAKGVQVETDENLAEYIITRVEGDMLYIDYKSGINPRPTKTVNVYVTAPAFKKLKASGACDINSQGKITAADEIKITLSGSSDAKLELNSPKVEADLSGACTVELKGETKELIVKGTGSSDIKCYDLMTENANIRISGAGEAEVNASVKLDVKVTGAGSVKYKGNPNVSQSVTGSGSVKKVE